MNVPTDLLPRRDGTTDETTRAQWFLDHYETSAHEILEFLAGDGITLEGRVVADVGNGDGIMDLGLVHYGRPKRLVGFDINLTDADALLQQACAMGVADKLPDVLAFERSERTRLPAIDGSFDVVISWSAFEHVQEPVPLLREIRRVLKPDGVFFLQIWPFYYSESGSHLWHWFPEGFANLRHTDDEIHVRVRADSSTDPAWIEQKLEDYRTLNRLTVDELQQALLVALLVPSKLELISHAVQLTQELNRYPLSKLGVSGVKLLANPV